MHPTLQLADGRVVDVLDGMVVGRLSSCSLRLDVAGVSRRHARFIVEAGVVEVEDLGSKNGTHLNGHPVTRRVVREGDELVFGKARATFHESGGEPKPVTTAVDLERDESNESGPPVEVDPFESGELIVGDGSPQDEVIEFVDEAVPVRRAPPPKQVAARQQQHRPAAAQRESLSLKEDVSQLGGMPRLLVMLAAVAFAAAVGWLAMTLATG